MKNFLLKLKKSFSDKHPENGFLYTVELLSDRPYAEALAIGDYQNVMEVLKMETLLIGSKLLKIKS
jgi:kynurenine 3-monooxygenase